MKKRRFVEKGLACEARHDPRAALQDFVHHAEGVGLVRLPRVVADEAGQYPGEAQDGKQEVTAGDHDRIGA